MAQYAHVGSLEALRHFRAALIRFADHVGVAVEESETEVQRTDMWLKQDRPAYWKHQLTVRNELYQRAKSALNRKRAQTTAMNNRLSCVDEVKAVQAAEKALEEARTKQESVRRWARLFEQEGFNYTAISQRLRTMLQGDVPRAIAQLDAMIAAIEAYGATPGPEWQTSDAGPLEGGMARRGAPTALGALAMRCARLRHATPSAAQRREAPSRGADTAGFEAAPTGNSDDEMIRPEQVAEMLVGTGIPPKPPGLNEQVRVAAGLGANPSIYLERVGSGNPIDSGWYVGPAGEIEPFPGVFATLTVGDLLARRPYLAAALEFPVGWLVLVNGARLEAVLDPRNVLRWPTGPETIIGAAPEAASPAPGSPA